MIDLEKFNTLFVSANQPTDTEQKKLIEVTQIENDLKSEWEKAETTEEIYRQYQKNIQKANEGMKEILKGAEYGVSLYNLFFKALEVIENMTNDVGVFTDSVRQKMQSSERKENFAEELNRAELEVTSKRLERLKTALQGANGDDRIRIENSIREHECRIAQLKKII